MKEKTLQIQTVLYHNEKESLKKSLDSIGNAIKINRDSSRELSKVTVFYGDGSKEPMYSAQEIDAMNDEYAGLFTLKYLFFNENTGTSKGHNKMGLTSESDFTLVMNPDIIICPRFFTYIFRPFQDESLNAGISEGRQTPIEHPKEYDKVTFETEWATGACMLMPTSIYKEVGGFDEKSFFMYCDDVDISWRVRLLGKKIYYCPDAVVFHAKTLSATATWQPTKAEIYYSAEAGLLMAYKWSNDKRVKKIIEVFSGSGDPILHKAVEHFEQLKASGELCQQLDKEHKVARFVGDNFTEHRFLL